jgi:hypothetical protein
MLTQRVAGCCGPNQSGASAAANRKINLLTCQKGMFALLLSNKQLWLFSCHQTFIRRCAERHALEQSLLRQVWHAKDCCHRRKWVCNIAYATQATQGL